MDKPKLRSLEEIEQARKTMALLVEFGHRNVPHEMHLQMCLVLNTLDWVLQRPNGKSFSAMKANMESALAAMGLLP